MSVAEEDIRFVLSRGWRPHPRKRWWPTSRLRLPRQAADCRLCIFARPQTECEVVKIVGLDRNAVARQPAHGDDVAAQDGYRAAHTLENRSFDAHSDVSLRVR